MRKKLITIETLRKNIDILQSRDRNLYVAMVGIAIANKLYKYGQIADRNGTQEQTYQKLIELNKEIEKHEREA